MKFEFRLKPILVLSVSLFLTWMLFFATRFFVVDESVKNQQFIPENATSVFQFNGSEAFSSIFHALVLSKKDIALQQQLDAFLKNKSNSKEPINATGIEFLKQFYVFTQSIESSQVIGILVPLSDEKAFLKRFSFASKSIHIQTIHNCGLILFVPSELQQQNTKIKKYVSNFFQKKSNYSLQKPSNWGQFLYKDQTLAGVQFRSDSPIQVYNSDNEISWNGSFTMQHSNQLQLPNWSLSPAHFHMSTAFTGGQMQDSLVRLISNFGLNLPKINYFSMNYDGIQFQESNGNPALLISPKLAILLHFDTEFSIKSLIQDKSALQQLGFTYENKTLTSGAFVYRLDSLDAKTLFIGLNRDFIRKQKPTEIFTISGDISRLTSISGGGFIGGMIGMYPPYRASNSLFEAMDKTEIHWKINGSTATFTGKLNVKSGRNFYHELIRFLLTNSGN